MGARANYVIIEDGVIDIYYSHWGAMSVPAVVIEGSEATRAYIRDEAPTTDSLMDDGWAEGGILLDMDKRALLFFGGENIRFSPPWQRILLHMMQPIWHGWSIAWAMRGIVDIAAYPGVAESLHIDPTSLIQRDEPVTDQPYTEVKIRDPHQNPWVYTVITVKWEDGRIGDYTFDSALDGYLLFGPGLLDSLRERESDALPREEDSEATFYFDAPDQDPREGVYINTGSRTMWVMHDRPLYSATIERIAQAWLGWRVYEQFEGLGHQVTLSGRSSALVAAPYEQVKKEVIGDLMHDRDDAYPLQVDEAIDLSTADSATIAAGLSRVVRTVPPPEERRAHLAHLLEEAVKRDQDDNLS